MRSAAIIFFLAVALSFSHAAQAERSEDEARDEWANSKVSAEGDPSARLDTLLDGASLWLLTDRNALLIRGAPFSLSTWARRAVTGVGGRLLGVDWRPADGRVYAIDDRNDLYRLDGTQGRAERVSALTAGFEGTPRSCFDFNPQADRLRLVAESGQNLRVHVGLGAVAIDGPLSYALGDENAGRSPRITACAYTDNVAEAPVTRLFDIDWMRDVLVLQDPPNDGELQTVGPLRVDFSEHGAFDILTKAGGEELALAVSDGQIHLIDLETGASTAMGDLGLENTQIIGMSVVPSRAPGR
ncbi:MAG: DUF4394 domain-containing protein [bacterium]|nr:DUF4394 domain-containing protein [bacterium]